MFAAAVACRAQGGNEFRSRILLKSMTAPGQRPVDRRERIAGHKRAKLDESDLESSSRAW